MMKVWWRIHQVFGVFSGIALIFWAFSGVLHPIIARLQPKPVTLFPPTQVVNLALAKPLASVMAQHRLKSVYQVGLATLDGQAYYQVWQSAKTPAEYFAVQDGVRLPAGDQRYALILARHFTGKMYAPAQVTWVSTFTADYPAVQKLLPLWRVDFNDGSGLRAYIDTQRACLSTLSDPRREVLMQVFRVLHSWSFLQAWPRVAQVGMLVLLGMLVLMTLSGLYLWWSWRKTSARRLKRHGLTRWHRQLTLWAALPLLMLSISAAYRVWHHAQTAVIPSNIIVPWAVFPRHALTDEGWKQIVAQPLSRLSLAWLNGAVVWQWMAAQQQLQAGERAQVAHLAFGEHVHTLNQTTPKMVKGFQLSDAKTGTVFFHGSVQLARELASQYAALSPMQIVSVRLVRQFGDEYGFFNKLLPVYRVEFMGSTHPRYYVDTVSGVLAARIDDDAAREGWSFSYLHKWNFIRLSKDWRDSLLAFGTLVSLNLAGIGLIRRWQRRLPRRLSR